MRLHPGASTGALSLLSILTATYAAPATTLDRRSNYLSVREDYGEPGDVRTKIDDSNTEGERHDDIEAPDGAKFISYPVDDGVDIAAFWSDKPNNDDVKHAYIVLHGKLRDGDKYFTTMNNILQDAADDNYPGADDESIIVAPQFFSKKLNSGQYSDTQMAWDDVNAWQAGSAAIHPKDTSLTSFDALDALVEEFQDQDKYPSMTNITVVGHGGGAQLNVRYAMVARKPVHDHVHIRYIHGDPSTAAYFTKNRVQHVKGEDDDDLPKREDCEYYNTWRYGFDEFSGTADGLKTPKEYFQQYISRDVVSIVGYDDTEASGDNLCAAIMQGGTKRRDRNLIWWQYVNGLARTNEDLTGFPGTFDPLPDWSDVSNNEIKLRLTVVENAAHDAEDVFKGEEGRSALFHKNVLQGWRPDA